MKTSLDKKIQNDVNRIEDFKGKLQKLNNAFKDGGVTMSSLEMLGEVICDGGEKPLPRPDHEFVVEKLYLRDTNTLDDGYKCNITGICRLTSGEFILLYNSNSKLKLLNSSFSVMSTSDVPNFPWDICSIGQREAAVALDYVSGRRGAILLVRVRSGTIEQLKTISFQHCCRGIAYHDDHFYVTTKTTLYKYDKEGSQGREMYNDPTGDNPEDNHVNRCAISPDGTRIFITNYTNHQLITLDKDGTKRSTFTDQELEYPAAVHVSPMGHVFVCCYKRNTVVQVVNSEKGVQSVRTLAEKSDGLYDPWALYFDSSKHTLVVGLADDRIAELKLK